MSVENYADRDGVIWYNGEMVPWREAQVHVLTHGLHYASSVFEGQRAYGGKIFELEAHTERLHLSADIMGFEIPYTSAEINESCKAVCEANGIVDGYIRPVAWRGSEMMGVSAQNNRINLAIAAWPWPSYFSPEARNNGIAVRTSEWCRPPPECAPVFAKAAGLYMICTLSKHAAEKEGFNDALMLDYRGQVAELTGANLFMTLDGDEKVLHTPKPDCFLNGITRQTVIRLAKARGIEVVERAIMPDELKNVDQIFATGSAAEVTPIGKIDDLSFTVGELTRTLRTDYEREVGKITEDEATSAA